MACSYFPRSIDRVVISALEARRPGVLLGVRGSGVSTTLKRAASIAGVPLGRGDCREFRAVEVDIGEVAEAAGCNWYLAATGSLEEVLRLMDEVEALVMPPLTVGELGDFLATFSQAAERGVLERLLYVTGGFPGAVCRALEELNYPGKITAEHVEGLSLKPAWFIEFVERYGRRFLRDAVLAYVTEEEAKELGVEPALWHDRRGGRLALKLPWLQFFAVHHDPKYAVEVLERAVEAVKDPGRLLYYYALLWRLGVDRYVERSARLVDAIYSLPPPAAAELGNYFLEVAPRVGKEAEAKAIHALSLALRGLEYRVEDVVYLAQRAARLAPRREAYDAVYNLGVLLLSSGRLREAEAVLATAEDLLFKAGNDEEWLRAKRVLHLLMAYREALLGNWREVARLLEDELSTLKFVTDYSSLVRRNLGWAYIMLGRYSDARHILRRTSGFQKWALLFLKTRNLAKFREKARAAGQDLLAALAGVALGLDVAEEVEKLDLRPELKELILAVLRQDQRRLAAVAAKIDPMDKLFILYYAVEAYLQAAAGGDRREIAQFLTRLRSLAAEAGMPGAAPYIKPDRKALARLVVFFL
ncbi:hypothetical protein ODS41_10085 [Pyrobaculum sp. 3827-6]|uniref:hypothetical protein n=1 Tax=Pyrobaculum sp. 3827-6 TaxID=2983604 RepID=UPI0021D8D90B|nr:hypothetical protein [Pyrobaculum sp. 3827-6]MCU7788258.1 hypothetical protein [Pyrobaculum sp. 3827-6]